jgi:DNA (cytosine-5)-methyltransferase 1
MVADIVGAIDCRISAQRAIGFNWQNAGGYGNANEGLGITVEGTGPLQRCQTPAVAHALRGEGFDASEDGTGRGTPIIPVAHAIGFIPKAPPNSRSMGEEVENGPTVTTHMMGQGVSLSLPMTVRRLTPRECERLQAFPDDYTLIPWRKKPADQCPDGPRYKALGNSMAVNCMEWIGERIAAYEAKERKQ